MALAGVLGDDVALRVDEHQRRPCARGVRLPGDELGVVEHRMLDLVALHGCRQRVRVGLVNELRRVHADDDQLPGVLVLQRTQLIEHVQAVHTAEGPEVEETEASAEVRERHIPTAGVQPAAASELWRADAGTDAHSLQSFRSNEATLPMLACVVSRAPLSPGGDTPPTRLHVDDTDFERVCVRRSGVAVYRGETGYLRIGSTLEPELAVHRLMLERDYPVPRILHVGRHDGVLYVIEESLGSQTLGDRFTAEQRPTGDKLGPTWPPPRSCPPSAALHGRILRGSMPARFRSI